MSGFLLHIYRGIQGSGKTTLALENQAIDGGRLVGRDHLRRLLGVQGLGTRKQEAEVTDLQGRLIAEGLRAGQAVHVDDMNLKATYVRRLMGIAEYYSAGVTIHDLTSVPLETCLQRNRLRSGLGAGFVNEGVILSNWESFIKPTKGQGLPVPSSALYDPKLIPAEPYIPDPLKPRAILVDLDGTAALMNGRGPHDYHRVSEDLPNQAVKTLVWVWMSRGYDVVYLSGRPDSCRDDTVAWLTQNFYVRGAALHMRRTGDHRPDFMVKRELFDKHVRNQYNVVFALDDRDQVVRMWRDLGLSVFQVNEGNF